MNLTRRQTLQNLVWPFLVVRCATSAQPCSHKASLNRPSVPPPGKKGNALQHQIEQVELFHRAGQQHRTLRVRLGRGRRTKCCSQGILRQLTDDRTPLVHHTLVQSAIEKTTATPLRAYEEPEALGYWGRVAPEAVWPPCQTVSAPSHIRRNLWNVQETPPGCTEPRERPTA